MRGWMLDMINSIGFLKIRSRLYVQFVCMDEMLDPTY